MLQVLQEEFGVRYNPARVADASFQDPKCHNPDFSDSRDLFIHGIIDGIGGTCASMPVLYVALGRRLGYPLKLAETRGHLFFRWDDPEGRMFGVPERVNFEGTGHGISAYADDHYVNWPEPLTETDKRAGWYLNSLRPNEELAAFLGTRGHCLSCVGRLDEALASFNLARGLAPNDGRYHDAVLHALRMRDRAALREAAHLAEIHEIQLMMREAQSRLHPRFPVPSPRIPAHPDCCQCANCRQKRDAAARAARRLPGHPPNCPCHQCGQPRQPAPFGY